MYSKKICNGYYMETVVYDKRLKFCPYGSAGIVQRENGAIIMVSYVTPVLLLENGLLQCSGIYSRTTAKHIAAFCKEYCANVSYYTCKEIAGKPIAINIATGEIVETDKTDREYFGNIKEGGNENAL